MVLLLLCISFEKDSDSDFDLVLNLYDSLLLEFLDLIHCVVLELVFLPNRFLQKGEMSRYYAM